MSTNRRNSASIFSDTVRLDAWMGEFDENKKADVFVDIVFLDGRIHADTVNLKQFRLRLKKAEVHMIVPDSEPIKIDKNSIARTRPKSRIKTSISEKNYNYGGNLEIAASTYSTNNKLKIGVGAGASTSASETIENVESVSNIQTGDAPLGAGHFWILSPESDFDVLEGRPWRPGERRAAVKLNTPHSDGHLTPTVRFEVHVRREDLDITEIFLSGNKKFNLWNKLSNIKKLIVIGYIKDELVKAGLECGDMNSGFSRLVISIVST